MGFVYVKLFASILDSSIWSENYPTRLVWITLLAMADAEGLVKASVSGVARRAAVTRKEAEAAIKVLLSPDKDRPDQEHEGRRLELVDGGWSVLNYQKYREIRTQQQLRDALRQRKHREQSRVSRDMSQHAEAYAEADTEKKKRGGPKAAWVVEMCEVWKETYGGTPNWGAIARTCQALAASVEPLELIEHWQNYLRATPARYATVKRFVETYGSWDAALVNGHISEDEAARKFREAGLDLSRTKVRPGGYENQAALEVAIQARKQAAGAR